MIAIKSFNLFVGAVSIAEGAQADLIEVNNVKKVKSHEEIIVLAKESADVQ